MIQYTLISGQKITMIENAAKESGMKKGAHGISAFVKTMGEKTGLNKDTILAIMNKEIGEEWKRISARFSNYSISNYGRVMGKGGKIMSTYINSGNRETFDPYDKEGKRSHVYLKYAIANLFLKMKKNEVASYIGEQRINSVHNIAIAKVVKKH